MVSEWRRIVADYSKLPPIDCWGIWWLTSSNWYLVGERCDTVTFETQGSHRWQLLCIDEGMTRVTEKWSSELLANRSHGAGSHQYQSPELMQSYSWYDLECSNMLGVETKAGGEKSSHHQRHQRDMLYTLYYWARMGTIRRPRPTLGKYWANVQPRQNVRDSPAGVYRVTYTQWTV